MSAEVSPIVVIEREIAALREQLAAVRRAADDQRTARGRHVTRLRSWCSDWWAMADRPDLTTDPARVLALFRDAIREITAIADGLER